MGTIVSSLKHYINVLAISLKKRTGLHILNAHQVNLEQVYY